MKVRVINEFRDKDNFSRIYSPGEIVSFDKSRVDTLRQLGLVDSVKSGELGEYSGDISPRRARIEKNDGK